MPQKIFSVDTTDNRTHFEQAVAPLPERSRVNTSPTVYTSFNAGRLVPIFCMEMLPSESISMSVLNEIRETTLKSPVFGSLECDIYAFYVPNRIVNSSWKAIFGEVQTSSVTNGIAPQISLNGLTVASSLNIRMPVGSIGDHYGLPTQAALPATFWATLNDLPFKGYYMIYNEYFRDQNYGALLNNVYTNSVNANFLSTATESDGDYRNTSILHEPLKVNKRHDYFTSVLPWPQKGQAVSAKISSFGAVEIFGNGTYVPAGTALTFRNESSLTTDLGSSSELYGYSSSTASSSTDVVGALAVNADTAGIEISELRRASAVQRYYEQLGRVGSRYREYLAGFFGIQVDDRLKDIPQRIGHVRVPLEMYQTAQTSSTEDGSTPQGNLAAFSYTNSGGKELLYNNSYTADEHGYLHVFAVVRHRNVYSTAVHPMWFRRNNLDFYQSTLANISEQPVYTRVINPFSSDRDSTFGYQEAWAEYRTDFDQVSGMLRPQSSENSNQSLPVFTYADEYSSNLTTATYEFMQSNTEDVVNRGLFMPSKVWNEGAGYYEKGPDQFKARFSFKITKDLPMPVYSVPELE